MAGYDKADVNIREIDGFRLERRDPFGFWYIESSKGATPKELKGHSFTNTQSAINALETYKKSQEKKRKEA